ncbi:Na+/H+ antiporter NhaC [Paludifilum halophilum]|uniref:Na+/H+ antiporter NhaC n=1 Tax=Paludifilum halophilum TaxID=1642702 RepID=A0A235B489_9BACL|nr:Na+/H+ antiporter NhaC [Paludifilum halophilum]OYD07104.1 Na+/H+ antiporter NhaC [Paludifilum halophilum]
MNQRKTGPVLLLFSVLFAILFVSLVHFQIPPHIPLLVSLVITAGYGFLTGSDWRSMEKGIITGISKGLQPILILLVVGLVIAGWMIGGTVPTLLVYGMEWIDPEWFAISALFITILVSTFAGSSFTTVGTIGVALMGVASAMGISPGLAAGAVICGACFGDKMSPLSDSTNLASGTAGVNLFTHIRHLTGTTVPALLVTVVLFAVIGTPASSGELTRLTDIKQTLQQSFPIHPLTLAPPLIVMGLAYRRYPVLPTLMSGLLASVLFSFVLIPDLTLPRLMEVLQNGPDMETGNEAVNAIVNKGGLQSMMGTVSLILITLALGGLTKTLGLFDLLLQAIRGSLRRTGHLIAATAASSVGVNLLAGEMYLSILLPGQAFKSVYEEQNIPLKHLSRTLEDAGTLINPLIPWGVSGAFFASTLGVSVGEYLPFTFFLYLSLLMTLIMGYRRQRS